MPSSGTPVRRSLAAASCGLALLVGALGISCAPLFGPGEGTVIEPARVGLEDSRLGPGVRALSAGPGDKSSPRPSPSGARVAFVSDGLAVEQPLGAPGPEARAGDGGETSETPDAVGVEWIGADALASFSPGGEGGLSDALSLSVAGPDGGELTQVAAGVTGTAALEGGGVLAALAVATESPTAVPSSRLATFRGVPVRTRLLPGELPGRVTGLSVSPDGREAALAIRNGELGEVWAYRFSDGRLRRLARLREGFEVLGDPQFAAGDAFFVVGEGVDRPSGDAASFALYRAPRNGPGGGAGPEPVEDVGEGFVAAGAWVSPEGGRLAVLGRRGASAPVELYVLDLASGELRAATSNEDMEIKTAPKDLAWTPDGEAVILVARSALPAPETYDGPASDLESAFFNLYEVPVATAP